MADTIPTSVTMKPVQSSQIKAVGHDAADNRLYVEFNTKTKRSVYSYANVTADHHGALMGEGVKDHSIGRHFGQHLKSNPNHPYTKLNLED